MNMKLNEPVWVTRVYETVSEFGGPVYVVELVGLKSQTVWKTYIDPKMRNYKNWTLTLSLAEQMAVILDVGLTVKDQKKMIINADSKPTVAVTTTHEEALDIIGEYWRGPNIGGIFE